MKKSATDKQTQPFRFFQRVTKAFVPELTEATFGRVAHARKTEICRLALRSALPMRKRHETEEVSLKFAEEKSGRHL